MIPKLLAPHADCAYALLRIVAGLLFFAHGVQKLLGLWGAPRQEFGSLGWFAGAIEFVTGAAMAIGFFTSWAAFFASGMMAVAYIKFHWNLQFGSAFFPIVNKGEPALLYCFLFLFVACKGAGPWSLDRRIAVRRAKEQA